MKKLLTFCILILLVPGLFGFTAYAYDYEPIKYEIEVEVTLGGTVKIIPNVNCPIEPGVFDYTVQTVPDDRNIVFDDTVYSIKIYVTECVNTLEANMIATKSEEKYSGSKLIFVNSEESSDEPTSNPQDSPTESSNNDRNPKTSDDTRMEMYFLFAMIASVGLLTLSIVYLIDTQKMIKKKNTTRRK